MIVLLLVPLIAPFAAAPLALRTVERLAPVAALRALTTATVLLAAGCLAALGLLLLAGSLRLPFLAGPGGLIHPLDVAPALFADPAAVLSAGAVALCVGRAARSAVRQWRLLRLARAGVPEPVGGLSVVDDEYPDAYALPGKPGQIVVTSGMLRALDPSEREALLAHERAHLAGRHHWYLAAAELSAHCHPGLGPVRAAVVLAAERAADEAAAAATGDRRVTARAIGRAALASHGSPHTRPSFTSSVSTGPVPRRVAALLQGPSRRHPLALVVALSLLLCAVASSTAALAGAVSLHGSVEVAQGESRGGLLPR